jgi:hypothetical protein
MNADNNEAEGNDLIVGFPSSIAELRVSFADINDGLYIRYPSATENQRRWYSKEDEARAWGKVLRDADQYSTVLAAARENGHQGTHAMQALLVRCVGLESLISYNVPQQYDAMRLERKSHVRIVLEEQRKQRLLGVVSSDTLARVSMTSSNKARKRARSIAKTNESLP